MEKSFVLSHGELKIPCKLLAPEDAQVCRLVLGIHGFGGCANDAIQVGIAEEMEMFSCAVLRFDFPAHGENPMDSEGLTLPNCRDTLVAAARWLRETYPEVEDLCVFATGFGAYMALLTLDELIGLGGKVKLVIQTPALLMHETMLAMKDMTAPTLEAMGKVYYRADRPFYATYEFYKQISENIVLTPHPIPMLILQGEEDSYIRMEHIRHFRRLNEDSKLVIIPGATHRFEEEGAWDMVLDLTRDWFEFEQVLCCDWE